MEEERRVLGVAVAVVHGDVAAALRAVDALKKQYPTYNLVAWENEGGGEPTSRWVNYVNTELGGMLPPELDAFSIDDYSLDAAGHRHFYESTIYPMLHPHQSVFLVPGSYSTGHDRAKSEWCCGGVRADALVPLTLEMRAQAAALLQRLYPPAAEAPKADHQRLSPSRPELEETPNVEHGADDLPHVLRTRHRLLSLIHI